MCNEAREKQYSEEFSQSLWHKCIIGYFNSKQFTNQITQSTASVTGYQTTIGGTVITLKKIHF